MMTLMSPTELENAVSEWNRISHGKLPLSQLLSVEHPLADTRHHREHAGRVGQKLLAVRLGLQSRG